jgi:hypothetical protein
MPDDQSEDHLESTIIKALVLRDSANSDEEWDELWSLLGALRPLGQVAFDRALDLLGVDDARALGCDLLGVLCNPDENQWSHEAAEALVKVSLRDDDLGVIWSVAAAFNHVADPLGVSVLGGYAGHPDKEIRLLVAQGITSCRTYEDDESVRDICDVLLPLTDDEDGDVRDWATFGLGHQLESDGPEVRRALANRLNDEHGDTHWEAVLGLARRHDRRAYGYVREGLLGEMVPKLAVWAAAWLGDVRLYALLKELVPWWSDWPYLLDRALEQCDPKEQERRRNNEDLFLKSFEGAVNTGKVPAGFKLAISCPCVGSSEDDVDLILASDLHENRVWGLHYLIDNACEGDPGAAVDEVIAEITKDLAEPNS